MPIRITQLCALALLGGCCAPPSQGPQPTVAPHAYAASEATRPASSPATTVPPGSAKAPADVATPGAVAPPATDTLAPATPAVAAAMTDSRDAADLALDPQRKPDALVAFAGIQPGMRVADLAAGGGYTTEVLARAVGPDGQVFAQNSSFILKRFAEGPLSARLQKPIMSRVMRVDSEFEDPLPGIHDLDAVIMVLFYHDTVWFETNRAEMNRAIFDALKPGGAFVVVDHSAVSAAGVSQAQSLHRIAEDVVVDEVQAAGFKLEQSADFLRNSEDRRDWDASPSAAGHRRGQSDRFVLRFVKPIS